MASERRARLEKLIIQYKAGDIDDKQLHGELQKLSKKSVPSNSINQLSSADNPVEQQNVEAVRVLMLEPEPSIHCFFTIVHLTCFLYSQPIKIQPETVEQVPTETNGDAAIYKSTALSSSVESVLSTKQPRESLDNLQNNRIEGMNEQWAFRTASRSLHQSTSREFPESYQNEFVHRSTDDSILSTKPNRPQVRDDDNEDLTFKPKIRPLPAHYGALKDEAMPIEQRFQKWSEEKKLNAKARRDDAITMQLDGCTFKPKINKSSKKAMDISRADDERPVPERLYTDALVARGELEEYKEALKEQAERDLKKECTFAPKTNTTRYKVEPKYNEPRSTSAPPRQRTVSRSSDDFQFTPKTNSLNPKMNAARAYCRENVFDRLSRTSNAEDDQSVASADATVSVRGRSTNVMDMSEFMSALQGGTSRAFNLQTSTTSLERQRPASATTSRRSFDSSSSTRIDK